MVKQITQRGRALARKVVLIQALTCVLLTLLALLKSSEVALSMLVGGGISVVAHLYFALKAFRYAGARVAQQIVSSFYAGEVGKFVIVFAGFALAFNFVDSLKEPQNALMMFSAFFLVHSVAWFTPLIIKDH